MRVLVGLGNPGEEYRETRHNIGFLVTEEIGRRHQAPRERRQCRSFVTRARVGESEVVLARPLTYMNHSGEAVAEILAREGVGPDDLLVICDDLYLDFGTLRLRPRGSHGGHNGLRSIIAALGTREFPRLRVGVGPAQEGVPRADYVLAPFRRPERSRLDDVVGRAADCAEAVVLEGIHKAMSRFNAPA